MSQPRFLADQDFNEHIIAGVLRREPAIEFVRLRDVGLDRGRRFWRMPPPKASCWFHMMSTR
jgi:hypothetical protein